MSWPSKVTPTAAPASVSPVQLADVKTELGITDSSQDTRLTRLIAHVSALMSGPEGIGRPFWRQSYVEDLAGRGGVFLPLSRWPVETVTQVDWDGSTVTASEYSLVPEERRNLYRSDGWNLSESADMRRNHRKILYQATYIAGWWMPDQEPSAWAATTAYSTGDFVKPATGLPQFYFEATAGGTSDGSEPTWPTTEGGTVTDSGVTWTARGASLLPSDLQEAALKQTMLEHSQGTPMPAGFSEIAIQGERLKFSNQGGGALLSPAVRSICARYR